MAEKELSQSAGSQNSVSTSPLGPAGVSTDWGLGSGKKKHLLSARAGSQSSLEAATPWAACLQHSWPGRLLQSP